MRKNALESIGNRADHMEDRISELKDKNRKKDSGRRDKINTKKKKVYEN